MKSLMRFWQIMLANAGIRCGVCTIRDSQRVSDRFEHEGLSFLTITLPNFAKDLEKDLDQGYVAPTSYAGFSRRRGLPQFLGGFLELVFDRENGCLRDDVNIEAIICLRQLTMLMGKIEVECTEKRTKAAFSGYVTTEAEVKLSDACRSESQKDDFRRMAAELFGPLFSNVEEKIYYGELVPKHGPGATADRLRGNAKFMQETWTTRLEHVFPYWEFARLGIVRSENDLDNVTWLEPGAEVPTKVTAVPKTLKTPRLIAEEPTCMQYMQQGISHELVVGIENHQVLGSLIGFKNQEPNRFMAEWGSVFGDLATLDLSEASDRVSNQHVRDLLSSSPLLRGAVEACRSRKADVPGNGVIRLAKFASMGSALTFPVEAMVFLTIVFIAIEKHLIGKGELKHRFSMRDLAARGQYHFLVDSVRVYGDDIVVPVDFAESVTRELEAFGLRVNRSKSFWTGKFRESCGGDFYDGQDVTPVRCRRVFPSSQSDAQELMSLVSLRNQLYWRGWWQAVVFLDEKIRVLTPFPIVLDTSPVKGRQSVFSYESKRMHRHYHTPLVRGAVVDVIEPKSSLDGTPALVKHFLKRSKEPYGKRHLERYGRSDSVRIKITWATPY